ncbi:MAG: hypothetical protein ACRCX2_03985 [Paraclostridium sp.]
MILSKYKEVINDIVKYNSNIYLQREECERDKVFFEFKTYINNNLSWYRLVVSNSAILELNFQMVNANPFLEIEYKDEYYFIKGNAIECICQFKSSKDVLDYILIVFKGVQNNSNSQKN